VGGIQCQLDVGSGRAGDRAEFLAGDWARIVKILALDRRDPFATDEIVVALAHDDLSGDLFQGLLIHDDFLRLLLWLRKAVPSLYPYDYNDGKVRAH